MAALAKAAKRERGSDVREREETPAPKRRALEWAWLARAAVIALAAFWVYAPVLRGQWVWDDTELVSEDKLVLDPAGLWKIWFEPGAMHDYQPLKYSLVWLQWHLWGDNTVGYHLTNVVLHIIGALLVWKLLQKLGLKLAWLGGLIFAVHPLQVESVAWISELKNTLSLPPFLLAMCAYIDFDKSSRRRDYALALGLFVIAMLCKTTMMMFPIVMLLYAWCKRSRVTWRDVAASVPFFAVSLALGWITVAFGPVEAQNPLIKAVTVGFAVKLMLAGTLVWFYIAKFFWPVTLAPTYPAWNIDAGSWLYLVPCLTLAAALVACWHWRATWGRGAFLGLGFFLVNLVPPVAFLVSHFPNVVFSLDHLLYIPILGLIGLVVAGLGKLDDTRASRLIWIVPATAALVPMAWESHAYSAAFMEPRTLWVYTLRLDPSSIPARMGLGEVLFKEGKLAEAAEQFRLVLQEAPRYAKANYNLGNVLVNLGQNDEALDHYEKAVEVDPTLRQGFINEGLLLKKMGRPDEAIAQLQQAERLEPDDVDGHMVLGDNLREAQRLDEATDEYRQAAQLKPEWDVPHARLAMIYVQQARARDAEEESDAALQLKPDDAEALFVRGVLEFFRGHNDEAESDFDKAIKSDPKLADAHFRRGTVLEMMGQQDRALADLQEGCRLAPKDGLANYARLSIWVLQAQMRHKSDADRDLAAAMGQSWNGAPGDWVTELAQFLLGKATEGDLMTTASGPSGSAVQVCEAWYFSGMKSLAAGDKDKAVDDLRKCVATGQENSVKLKLAQAELASLGVD